MSIRTGTNRSHARHIALGGVTLVMGVLIAGSAGAQEGGADVEPPPPYDQLDFELGLSSPSDDSPGTLVILRPKLGVTYSPIDDLVLQLDWGIAILRATGGGESATEARGGNPALSASYRLDLGGSQLLIGGGVALPVAQFGDEAFLGAVVLVAAAALDGNQDFWLWLPETLTFYAPARWDMQIMESIRLSADGALAVYIPTSEGRDTDVGLQLGAEAAWVHGRSSVGVRLQVTSVFEGEDVDLTQVALVPQGRLDLGGGYLHGRFVINLDEPYGFAFDDGRFWGFFVGGGVYL